MNPAAKAAGRRLLPVYKEVDDAAGKAVIKHAVSCRRGCAACCHLLVTVSVLEAVLIAEYLLTSDVWKPRIPELKKKLKEQADFIDSLGGVTKGMEASAPYLLKKIPCVFLKKNNDCGIYGLRPIVCRTYFVVSPPEDCDTSDPEKGVMGLDVRQIVHRVWAEGLSREERLVPPIIDSFQRAMLIAFELLEGAPEKFREWLGSEPRRYLDTELLRYMVERTNGEADFGSEDQGDAGNAGSHPETPGAVDRDGGG